MKNVLDTEDVIFSTFLNTELNPIFHAKDIGSEYEFDRDDFEWDYYHN